MKHSEYESRKLTILRLLKEGASYARVGVQLGCSKERVRQIVESMKQDPVWEVLISIALQQKEEIKKQKIREYIYKNADVMPRSAIKERYKNSKLKNEANKIADEVYSSKEFSEIKDRNSLIGKEVNDLLAVEFLGKKKPDGSFTKKQLTKSEDRPHYLGKLYYKVKCLRCGTESAKQKSYFATGRAGCRCNVPGTKEWKARVSLGANAPL
jgi:hypothetical protein